MPLLLNSSNGNWRKSKTGHTLVRAVVSKLPELRGSSNSGGYQEELKERIVSVETFGRQPGYDLNADPMVRVTAGEVRKRLAQYCYEPEHLEELRIELRPGSWVPDFKLPAGQAPPHTLGEPEVGQALIQPTQALPSSHLPSPTSTPDQHAGLLLSRAGGCLFPVDSLRECLI